MSEDALLDAAVNLVSSNIQGRGCSDEEINTMISSVYTHLNSLKSGDSAPANRMSMITKTHVRCLECDKTYKLISNRHLKTHDLTSREYRKKHGIPLRQSLSCTNLTNKRRKKAKEMGLGQALVKYRAERIQTRV